jgi:hypothetical protein
MSSEYAGQLQSMKQPALIVIDMRTFWPRKQKCRKKPGIMKLVTTTSTAGLSGGNL